MFFSRDGKFLSQRAILVSVTYDLILFPILLVNLSGLWSYWLTASRENNGSLTSIISLSTISIGSTSTASFSSECPSLYTFLFCLSCRDVGSFDKSMHITSGLLIRVFILFSASKLLHLTRKLKNLLNPATLPALTAVHFLISIWRQLEFCEDSHTCYVVSSWFLCILLLTVNKCHSLPDSLLQNWYIFLIV